MTGQHAFWYLSRASGLTAVMLLAGSTAMGFALAGRLRDRRLARWLSPDLHQYVSVLAIGFAAFHVFILLGDRYYTFSLVQLLVPFAAPYRRTWTGLGSLALWMVGVLYGSFYARRLIGYRGWRLVHYATPVPLALAVAHGLAAGSDTASLWARVLVPGAAAVPLGALAIRLLRAVPRLPDARRTVLGRAAALSVTLTFGGLALVTAAAVLAPAGRSVVSPIAALLRANAGDLVETVDGTVIQQTTRSGAVLQIDARADGDLALRIMVRLAFRPPEDADGDGDRGTRGSDGDADDQRLQVVANEVQMFDENSGAGLCAGSLTALDEDFLALSCRGADDGEPFSVNLQGRVRVQRDGSLQGTLSGNIRSQG